MPQVVETVDLSPPPSNRLHRTTRILRTVTVAFGALEVSRSLLHVCAVMTISVNISISASGAPRAREHEVHDVLRTQRTGTGGGA